MKSENMHFVIMAGGRGTRFWPKSTSKKPKQFLNLVGNRSLLQQTVNRILPISKPDNVYIVTDATLQEEVRRQLPSLPRDNIIIEPTARGTLPCVSLAALHILRKDKKDKDSDKSAVMSVLPADHFIVHEEKFRQSLLFAQEMAQVKEVLITFGIKPTRPETGYGYIRSDRLFETDGQFQAFEISEFVEKPNRETALQFVESGKYLWNSGMFIWNLAAFMEAVRIQASDIYELLCHIDSASTFEEEQGILKQVYPFMRNVSIDHGIMEKASNRIVIAVDIGWDDLGCWTSMEGLWKNKAEPNACIGRHIGLDTQDCIIYSPNKLVATIGLKDLIVVEAENVLLICSKDRAQEVKTLVAKLSEEGLSMYL